MMVTTRTLLMIGFAFGATMAATPAMAQQQTAAVCAAPGDANALQTDKQILDALIKRRAEIEAHSTSPGYQDAVGFLDSQIAQVRARITACTPKG